MLHEEVAISEINYAVLLINKGKPELQSSSI
jgi:hypothetical protein